MLETVAPEASYEQISGQILQNHDFQVGGKFRCHLLPGMVFSFLKIKFSRSGDTIRTAGVLGSLRRVLRGSRTGPVSLGRVSGGPWGVLEWSLDGLGDVLSES